MGKGEDFEREQCRYLSMWWTEGRRDDVFWRNRRRITYKDPSGKHQLGDVMSMDPEGLPLVETFNIELKRGYSKTRKGKRVKNVPWDVLDLIDYITSSERNVFLEFWRQTLDDARLSNRSPMLIFKRDYHSPVVCVDLKTLHSFSPFLGAPPKIYIVVSIEEDKLFLFREDEFFSWLTPDIVKIIYTVNEGKVGR